MRQINNRHIRQREKILSTANRLFLKQGYVGTSLEDVAKAAKINKSSFYNYFKKKSDLLQAFILPILHQSEESEKVIKSNLSPSDKLKYLIINDVRMQLLYPGVAQIGRSARVYLPFGQRKIYNEQTKKYRLLFQRIIEEGIKSGDFKRVDPEITTLFIIGFLHSIFLWYDKKGRIGSEEISQNAFDFIYRSLSNIT
jgi:TetR/AcrR family transcriptional regulator, cholesterol catabolism regulator